MTEYIVEVSMYVILLSSLITGSNSVLFNSVYIILLLVTIDNFLYIIKLIDNFE